MVAIDVKVGESLLDCGDLIGFWREFIGSKNGHSEMNKLLVRAASMTVEMLDGAADDFDEIIDEVADTCEDEGKWDTRVQIFRERFNA